MKIFQNSKLQFWGITILLILLPVLAILQYNWLGQLSDAEQIRMQTNLQTSAERFSEEFDKILTSIYSSFNKINLKSKTNNAKLLNETFLNWKNNTDLPGMITSIYTINLGPTQEINFYKLDTNIVELKQIKWPKKLMFLKKYFNQDIDNIFFRLITLTHGPILKPNPMIMVTQPSEILLEPFEENCADNWLILVVLNEELIMNSFIPYLAEKYFYQEGVLNYNIMIAKKGEELEEFYKSDENLTLSDFSNPDAQTNLGSWRTRNMIIASAQYISDKGELNLTRKIEKEKSLSIKILTGDSTKNSKTSNYLIAKLDRWLLLVKHIDGSLESIVSQNRIKNLVISYVILIILGVGIILALVYARRIQKIGKQQIEFVAGVTHELRTPLAVINSAGENLVDGVVKSDEQYKKYGSLIRDEGKRLGNMIEQVLDYAGIQSKKQLTKFEIISLNELIIEIIQKFNKSSKISFEKKYENSSIKGDKKSLDTAISNIIDNSIKYASKKSEVNLVFERSSDNKFYIIKIEDFGFGINENEIPHIFEPFYRGKNATESTIPGSGLGLSLVKGIIENHEGEITVKSEKNKGTTFTIKLPVFEND